ncbi:ferredoxin Fer [Halalkalicoccus jeotgali]|uniref:DnaJ N-terminal domain-containing protein n=1 Tax=Halalkalicoccus jeotgali (strain DSM 18796 / CECT 7217 / JCM 14584 / KCTC 4019 / B3) TaxID=795797 RepID=D8J6U8_HALJB|nr:ferredoxin Fer [Halalkalicoccus jeotgali]ADJ15901.1 DnaJ N-terminal domain-containing protein [Halalkalicoccus jeotgali B3]ELY37997.1 DnaJ N-terminal domain-containing protein [Halalkalicoccus jeotgali B3]
MVSPYEVLSVDPDADDEEVARAYRRRVIEAHPDQGGSAREFQLVREAYEELTVGSRPEAPSLDTGIEEEGSDPGDEEDEELSRVEYLNYEVLDDHGWTLDEADLFEKAADAGLDGADYGRFLVQPNESLLEAAENRGFAWPYACRGGACANCAVAVLDGELSMPVNHVLPAEMLDRGIRLSCNGTPSTDELRIVYNIKHLPYLDKLRLPPRPFEQAHVND